MNSVTIEYSKDALEVKSLFYGKKFSVYVEGEDDIIFWQSLFKIAGYRNIHVEDVGGYSELKPYMEKIINEDAKILVAADTDHRDIIGFDFEDDRIVRTYGYSIENSMYNTQRVEHIIRKLSTNKPPKKEEITQWRVQFSAEARKLLIYSIANALYDKGEKIFGEKCSRFLRDNSSNELCATKIDRFLSNLSIQFSEEELKSANELLEKSTKDTWFLIKGHFITNGVLNHITTTVEKITGRKPSVSLDVLYALCIDNEELKNKVDEDIKHMIGQIKKAMDKVKR